ncbi:uncharacterized protein LOC106179349 [Lingula anatina]|uniref:Uncharacterized protein LOC106179349 n=1 Tax=Lingula anatina TaxID=7574 RepID=A0A1S3K6Z9_LINAN|nr:uncharacterized protein LOC106179349 [Lingula anatina]|eukprot:XP_013418408.1 uncharacterized protein LOC106179349 [Lingula anatina]
MCSHNVDRTNNLNRLQLEKLGNVLEKTVKHIGKTDWVFWSRQLLNSCSYCPVEDMLFKVSQCNLSSSNVTTSMLWKNSHNQLKIEGGLEYHLKQNIFCVL